jgi:hypothetical protein
MTKNEIASKTIDDELKRIGVQDGANLISSDPHSPKFKQNILSDDGKSRLNSESHGKIRGSYKSQDFMCYENLSPKCGPIYSRQNQ